ncbi:unnamed protein product [Heterobilharzia americana]|nr:unnamed protein product [Heterobilharzia americana]
MSFTSRFVYLNPLRRSVFNVASASKATQQKDIIINPTFEGIQLVSLPHLSSRLGLSRIALVIKSGPKYESSKNRGISHLLRRSFGISTPDFTSVNLTRHFQQMGARVQCKTTREHTIYTVDIAPNFAVRAGHLLCCMAFSPCYYAWELQDIVYRLMRKDVDILNRQNLSGLNMELLHEAAFGTSDSGCGLGYSLIAPDDRVGSHSINQIKEYHSSRFTAGNCVLGIAHADPNNDGMDILNKLKSVIHINPPLPEKRSAVNHGFIGGEVRRDLVAASTVYAYLAWPVNEYCPVNDLIVCALNGSSNRIEYGGNACKSLLARTAVEGDSETEALAFHKSYSVHGLLGISVAGTCPEAVRARIKRIVSALRSETLTEENLKQAKKILKADLMFRYEDPLHILVDISTNLLSSPDKCRKPTELVPDVDQINLSTLNEAMKKIVNNQQVAFSLVGPNLGVIEPAQVLLKV